MITISNSKKRSFLIYKSHYPDLNDGITAILKNELTDREIRLFLALKTHHNSWELEITNEDLSKAIGQNKLLIYNAADELVYNEDATITE